MREKLHHNVVHWTSDVLLSIGYGTWLYQIVLEKTSAVSVCCVVKLQTDLAQRTNSSQMLDSVGPLRHIPRYSFTKSELQSTNMYWSHSNGTKLNSSLMTHTSGLVIDLCPNRLKMAQCSWLCKDSDMYRLPYFEWWVSSKMSNSTEMKIKNLDLELSQVLHQSMVRHCLIGV